MLPTETGFVDRASLIRSMNDYEPLLLLAFLPVAALEWSRRLRLLVNPLTWMLVFIGSMVALNRLAEAEQPFAGETAVNRSFILWSTVFWAAKALVTTLAGASVVMASRVTRIGSRLITKRFRSLPASMHAED